MDVKLYVGNMSYETSEDELNTLFSGSGNVKSIKLIRDRDTGRSKGFAFIEMSTQVEAEQAVKDINGKRINNRPINVKLARPPKERSYSNYNNYSSNRGNRDRKRR